MQINGFTYTLIITCARIQNYKFVKSLSTDVDKRIDIGILKFHSINSTPAQCSGCERSIMCESDLPTHLLHVSPRSSPRRPQVSGRQSIKGWAVGVDNLLRAAVTGTVECPDPSRGLTVCTYQHTAVLNNYVS